MTDRIHINIPLQISDGSQGANKIFTSDAVGLGSWTPNDVAVNKAIIKQSDAQITSPHGTLALNGKFYISSVNSASPASIIVYNDPNDLSNNTVIATGISSGAAIVYGALTGKIYTYQTGVGGAQILEIDPATNTYTAHSVSGLANIDGSGMDTDGTYIYISSYSAGSIIKIQISSWTIVASAVTFAGEVLHDIRYVQYSDGAEIIATTASVVNSYVFTINPSTLAFTSINTTTFITVLTDDMALIKNAGNVVAQGCTFWCGSENQKVYRFKSINRVLSTNASLNDTLPSYGLFTDGTTVYNVSKIGYIETWPFNTSVSVSSGASTKYYVGEQTLWQPNELWIADNGKLFFTNFASPGGIYEFTFQNAPDPYVHVVEEDYATFLIGRLALAGTSNLSVTSPLTITSVFLKNNPTLAINNAKADGTTKGAATFKATDFTDNGSGLISLKITSGTSTQSGDGTTTAFVIAHGLTGITSGSIVSITPRSAAAAGIFYVTTDATNITITYTTAPGSGTNNLTWTYQIKP